MSYVFNPFTGTFDIAPPTFQWKAPVATLSALPVAGNTSGDVRVTLDSGSLYEYNGTAWQSVAGSIPLTNGHIIVGNASNLGTDVAMSGDTSIINTGAVTVNSVGGSTASSIHLAAVAVAASTSSNTPSTLVLRDGSGNFSAGIISASLIGHASLDLALTGGTMSGQINMGSQKIVSMTDPTSAQDAATKNYTDTTFIPLTQRAANNGVATLDSSGKIPVTQLPSVVMEYQGAWNPNTNTPTLSDGTGTNGFVYYVTALRAAAVSGLTDPSMVNFQIGDLIIYTTSVGKWQLVTPAAGVSSVNSAQGAVTVNAINQLTGDVTAGPASGSASAASTIGANVVTNSKLAQMATLTIKGNNTGGTTNALDLTVAQVNTMLGSVTTASSPLVIASNNITFSSQTANTALLAPNGSAGVPTFRQILAADIGSGVASSGTVLTSNGTGGATFAAIAGFANTTLSNLVAPTSINRSLLTSSAGVASIGSNVLYWAAVYAATINDSGNKTSVDVFNRQLADSVSVPQLTWSTSGITINANPLNMNSHKITSVTDPTNPQDAATKNYVDSAVSTKSPGDLAETSFTAADNQAAAANITGFAFANATVRSFDALVSILRGTTMCVVKLIGIQKTASWTMAETENGDVTGITFSITTAGQVQYTSTSTGSTSTIKFRAITTSV